MSLVKQLVEEIEQILQTKLEWKRTSDELPDPHKFNEIRAWHRASDEFVTLRVYYADFYRGSNGSIYTVLGHPCYYMKFKEVFSCWKVVKHEDHPPEDYKK